MEPAREVPAGDRRGLRHDVVDRSPGHHLSALHARPRPHVDDPVRLAYRTFVVLDHDDRIAEIAQPQQGVEQPAVVPLVQPDGRLVQNVHHSHEPGSDLTREPDAPPLAPGQRVGGSIEGEIVEPHVDEEIEPLGDLVHEPSRNLAPVPVKGRRLEETAQIDDRQAFEPGKIVPRHEHRAGVEIEPRTAAFGARPRAHVAGQLLAHVRRLRLPVTALHVRNDALERSHGSVAPSVPDLDGLAAAAVKHRVADVRRQLVEGKIELEPVVRGEGPEEPEVIGVAPVPAAHRSARQAELGAGHDALRIEIGLPAKAVARGARARRAVEGEQPRLKIRKRVAAFRAGEAGREDVIRAGVDTPAFGVDGGHRRPAVRER